MGKKTGGGVFGCFCSGEKRNYSGTLKVCVFVYMCKPFLHVLFAKRDFILSCGTWRNARIEGREKRKWPFLIREKVALIRCIIH